MTTKQQLLDFDNLAFHTHPSCPKAVMAQLKFGDFMISVVANTGNGRGLYGHVDDNEYEVLMTFKDGNIVDTIWKDGKEIQKDTDNSIMSD